MEGDSPQEPGLELAHADRGSHRMRRWGVVFLAMLPAVLPLYVICRYHVNFIWNDAWDVANLLVKSHRGTLQFADFWAPHLEHRMPVPYLIMFVLAKLTGWNTYAEVIFGYFIVCGLSGLLAMLLRSTGEPDSTGDRGWVWRWFLINVLIFSPIQGENWLFGFTACQNFIAIPCMVGAMLLIRRRGLNWKTLIAAGVLVEIAACTQANGLLGWFVLLPIIAMASSWREFRGKRWLVIAWIGMGVVSFVTYFVGYSPQGVVNRYYDASPIDRIRFFLAFLGTPLCFSSVPQSGLAVGIGLVLMVAYGGLCFVAVRRWLSGDRMWVDRSIPWLAIGSYSLASAAMGAWGRAGMGVGAAATTRYTTISICLLIGLVGMLPLISEMRLMRWRLRFVTPIVSTGVLIGLSIGAIRSRGTYVESAHERLAGLAHLSLIRILSEPMGGLLITFDPKLAENAVVLDQMGFIHPPLVGDPDITRMTAQGWDTDSAKALSGAVEGARPNPDGTIQMWGWAVLHEQRRLADAVLVTYEGANQSAILCAIGDVRVPEGNPIPVIGNGRPNATWLVEFPANRLPQQARRIRCWAYDAVLRRAYPLKEQ